MSRRIAIGVMVPATVLIAAAVLIAAPARADRECFENSCRMPEVVDPPSPQAVPSSVGEEPARPKAPAGAARPRGIEAVRAQTPGGLYPEMLIDQKTPKPPQPAARRNTDMAAPRAPAWRYERTPASEVAAPLATPAPVAVTPLTRTVRSRVRTVGVPGPSYIDEPAPAAAAVIGVPAEIYADDGVVAAYPEPSWKLCQIDEPGPVVRYYRCGPYSYHPYGEHGYRPFGTYRAYRSAPGYIAAPNAKIISIQRED